jgi:hypothetical protein
MSDTHDVISAFLDDEPFDASQLAQALSEPDGRALLIDLLALRHVIQPGKEATLERPRKRPMLRALMAAAALVVALVGGYAVGQRQSESDRSEAPAATRVVEAPAAWQVLP